MGEEIKDDLIYEIIGCAIKVPNTPGSGFQEVIYQRALAIELRIAGLEFVREWRFLYTIMGKKLVQRS